MDKEDKKLKRMWIVWLVLCVITIIGAIVIFIIDRGFAAWILLGLGIYYGVFAYFMWKERK